MKQLGTVVPLPRAGTEVVNSPLLTLPSGRETGISHPEEAGLSAATPQKVGDTNPLSESLNKQLELKKGQRNLSLFHTL